MALRIFLHALIATALMAAGTNAEVWAQFCDDTSCSENCGEAVSVNDAGCLAESGRKSIMFYEGGGVVNSQAVALLFSPDDTCSCQMACTDDLINGFGDNKWSCLSITPHS